MSTTASRVQFLKTQFAQRQAVSRPIITFINGDVAWLISFPQPTTNENTNNKVYYHVVIDPWFGQPVQVLTSLLLEMKLGRDPALPNRAAIDTAIVEIELAAGNNLVPTHTAPAVDAIFITGVAEHCSKESLLQFATSTPVFAVDTAARDIAPWGYFDTVVSMPSHDPSKASFKEGHPGLPLPEWLTAFPPTVTRPNNFGLALITSVNPAENELILVAPHGISADEASIKGLASSTTPAVKMLALLAPLKDSYAFGVQSILGAKDGLAIMQAMEAQYYVHSGDIVSLLYRGFIGWFVRDVPRNLQWGVDELRRELGPEKPIKEPTVVEVDNGGSYVLV